MFSQSLGRWFISTATTSRRTTPTGSAVGSWRSSRWFLHRRADLRSRGSWTSARVDRGPPGTSREPRRSVVTPRSELAGHRRGRRGAAMTLLAGLAVGVFVYLLVGYATGYTPEIKIRRLRRRAQISNRQLWLNQAGVAVTPRQFVAGSLAVGAVAFVAIVAVTGAPLVALVPAAGVAALPRAYFARRRTAHLRQVQAAWPDGLRDVIASIAAGRSLSQALNALEASGPVPLQDAFTRFPMLSRMLGTVPALEVIKEELADPTSDRVIEVLVIAHERGGQIVRDILEDLVAST